MMRNECHRCVVSIAVVMAVTVTRERTQGRAQPKRVATPGPRRQLFPKQFRGRQRKKVTLGG